MELLGLMLLYLGLHLLWDLCYHIVGKLEKK